MRAFGGLQVTRIWCVRATSLDNVLSVINTDNVPNNGDTIKR